MVSVPILAGNRQLLAEPPRAKEVAECQGPGNICALNGIYACCEGLVCSNPNIVIGVCTPEVKI